MSHFFTRASHARVMEELTKLRQELIEVSPRQTGRRGRGRPE